MIRRARNNKNKSVALTIALILVVTIVFVFSSFFSDSNTLLNIETILNQDPKQSSPPLNVSGLGLNESNSLNETNSAYTYSSVQVNTDPISLETLNSTNYKQPGQSRLLFSFPNNPYERLPINSISLDASKFITYTYGGYSVQQPDSTQFILSFPDNTSQGQIAGSDALTLNTYAIEKIDFDSLFTAPKIGALGFDEMVIFATSDTNTYKGTEFGIRLDLSDGFIYGYNQEPNGNFGEVDFQMLKLMPNDGIIHHYTLSMIDAEISFYIDGVYHGYLSFPSNSDYSILSFSILAVVHRFTEGWNSVGDNMIVENFSLNQH